MKLTIELMNFFLIVLLFGNFNLLVNANGITLRNYYNEPEAKRLSKFSKSIHCARLPLVNCPFCLAPTKSHKLFFFMHLKRLAKYHYKFMIHYDDKKKEVVISFGGPDIEKSPDYLKVIYSSEFVKSNQNTKIEKEFYETYFQKIRKNLLPKLIKLIKSGRSNFNFVINGYSIGGSIAVLTALDIVNSGFIDPKRLRVYTFGALRIGNEEFVSVVNSRLHLFQIRKANDFITKAPSCFFVKKLGLWKCLSKYLIINFYRFMKHSENLKKLDQYSRIREFLILFKKDPLKFENSLTVVKPKGFDLSKKKSLQIPAKLKALYKKINDLKKKQLALKHNIKNSGIDKRPVLQVKKIRGASNQAITPTKQALNSQVKAQQYSHQKNSSSSSSYPPNKGLPTNNSNQVILPQSMRKIKLKGGKKKEKKLKGIKWAVLNKPHSSNNNLLNSRYTLSKLNKANSQQTKQLNPITKKTAPIIDKLKNNNKNPSKKHNKQGTSKLSNNLSPKLKKLNKENDRKRQSLAKKIKALRKLRERSRLERNKRRLLRKKEELAKRKKMKNKLMERKKLKSNGRNLKKKIIDKIKGKIYLKKPNKANNPKSQSDILNKIKQLHLKIQKLFQRKFNLIHKRNMPDFDLFESNLEREIELLRMKLRLLYSKLSPYYQRNLKGIRRTLLQTEIKSQNSNSLIYNLDYFSVFKSLLSYNPSVYFSQPMGVILYYLNDSMKGYSLCRYSLSNSYPLCEVSAKIPFNVSISTHNKYFEDFTCKP